MQHLDCKCSVYVYLHYYGMLLRPITMVTHLGTNLSVSTEVGDRIWVQFPVGDIYLGTWPATQVNSAWPSLRG